MVVAFYISKIQETLINNLNINVLKNSLQTGFYNFEYQSGFGFSFYKVNLGLWFYFTLGIRVRRQQYIYIYIYINIYILKDGVFNLKDGVLISI